MIKSIKYISGLLLIILIFNQCGKQKKNQPAEEQGPFDKQGMLTNFADNLILPAYQNFSNALDSLLTAYNTFKSNQSLTNFKNVKLKLVAAYSNYQNCDLYEFGPAETFLIRSNFNVFPTDTIQIKSNIANGTYNLSTLSNFDAKGFPALDYLFYSVASEQQVLETFSISPNKVQYANDLIMDMRSKLTGVINLWNSGYKATFVNSLGVDVGSSIGYLVNQLNFQLDYLKNAKIGIPLGKKSLGVKMPEKCESFYNAEMSINYLQSTLAAIENTYLGKSISGSNGLGFDDYLDHLKVNHTNGTLNEAIKNQFNVCYGKIDAIKNSGHFKNQIISNAQPIDALYTELVKLLVLLKTDMPSNLGVVITYQDGDGD